MEARGAGRKTCAALTCHPLFSCGMPPSPAHPARSEPLALLLALASGSVWGFVSLMTGRPAGWMALLAAIAIASAPAQLGAARSRVAVAASTRLLQSTWNALLLLLATAYSQYLGSASVVSRELGFDYFRTLREIGPGLAFSLAASRASTMDWIALGIALGGMVLWSWRVGRLKPGALQYR